MTKKTVFQIQATQSDWDKFRTMVMGGNFDDSGILYQYEATVWEDEDPIKIQGIGCTEDEQELGLWAQFVEYPDGESILRLHAATIDFLAQARQFDNLTENEKDILDRILYYFKVDLEEGTVEYK